jgi:hypothetical protein
MSLVQFLASASHPKRLKACRLSHRYGRKQFLIKSQALSQHRLTHPTLSLLSCCLFRRLSSSYYFSWTLLFRDGYEGSPRLFMEMLKESEIN